MKQKNQVDNADANNNQIKTFTNFSRDVLSTPRKMHLVFRAVKKIKNVNKMLFTLKLINKKAAKILYKSLQSAKANAESYNANPKNLTKIPIDQLTIEHIYIADGKTRKRWMPRARGNSARILKRTTNINLSIVGPVNALSQEENKESQ